MVTAIDLPVIGNVSVYIGNNWSRDIYVTQILRLSEQDQWRDMLWSMRGETRSIDQHAVHQSIRKNEMFHIHCSLIVGSDENSLN